MRLRSRAGLRVGLTAAVALGVATVVVALLERPPVGLPDASGTYVLAVVLVATLHGTRPAIVTALGAFLLYDVLFTDPRGQLVVADPTEWLELLVFLVVAVAAGRLTALGTERAAEAHARATESQALFFVSRTLATAPDLISAAPSIADRLARDAAMDRVWIGIGPDGQERTIADTGAPEPHPAATVVEILARTPGDAPARWIRAHDARAGATRSGHAAGPAPVLHRVRIEADGSSVGSVWASRERDAPQPSPEATRLLALAADQLALAIGRESAHRAATEAEVARRSDALKSGLLESVSHDLRTPLAAIRATAGTLADPTIDLDVDERSAAGRAIDAEAERMSRLVRALLDLGRIESGTLHPEPEVVPVDVALDLVIDRSRSLLGDRPLDVDVPRDVPPVWADPALLDQVLGNLLENAARHTPPATPVRVRVSATGESVRVCVDDAGPGVPDAALSHIFDRFYRVPGGGKGSRPGMGVGLSVAKGFTEAMGGRITARRSDLGGLAICIELPAGSQPSVDVGRTER